MSHSHHQIHEPLPTHEPEEGCCGHNHACSAVEATPSGYFKLFRPALISLLLLLLGLGAEPLGLQGWMRTIWYLLAYLPVGVPVLKSAYESVLHQAIFSEFFLMAIATVGAFAIGEYPEGVAVMLFYSVGEAFQGLAVRNAKANIQNLLDQRPEEVTIVEGNTTKTIKATEAKVGDVIQLKPGEKLGLDGVLLSESSSFDTAALTGESKPDTKQKGAEVFAGMINLQAVAQVKVTAPYEDSKWSKIVALVQKASRQKTPTELFIRKFAKIYTPAVVALAVAICFLPYFFVATYEFREWLYRSLIFLVISCPCALVISIPLGYFGGIGAASSNGILVKGGQYLDALANIKNVVMDKTGTMTEGVFKVEEVHLRTTTIAPKRLLAMVNALEHQSTHPIASAFAAYVGKVDPTIELTEVEEISGYGLKATIEGKPLLVGSFQLMERFGIPHTVATDTIVQTVVAIAYDHAFAGYITIADRIKSDARATIEKLEQMGVRPVMLSGDKATIVQQVAKQLGIKTAFGGLSPEEKVARLKEVKAKYGSVAFVGDGINDAPVIAISDVGIAMGGLGSDAAIESADVVIQDDQPSKIPMVIKISQQNKRVVVQNIAFAFFAKGMVLLLGATGYATLWEAVFADVGVALLAILNAVRIQKMRFF